MLNLRSDSVELIRCSQFSIQLNWVAELNLLDFFGKNKSGNSEIRKIGFFA